MKWSENKKRRWLIEQGHEERLLRWNLTNDPATTENEAKRKRSENWHKGNMIIAWFMHEGMGVKRFESMPNFFNRVVEFCNTPQQLEKLRHWIEEQQKVYKKSKLPAGLRQDVLQRDKFTCQHCGRKAPEVVLHVDHILPESKGGQTKLENLQVLCEECNIGKGNRYSQ